MTYIPQTREELETLIAETVSRVLAAQKPKEAPAPAVPAVIGMMDVGPLIGRAWCRDTARAVTEMEGFPPAILKGKRGRSSVYPGPATLRWLEQHIGILPFARAGRASNDARGRDAVPCA